MGVKRLNTPGCRILGQLEVALLPVGTGRVSSCFLKFTSYPEDTLVRRTALKTWIGHPRQSVLFKMDFTQKLQ